MRQLYAYVLAVGLTVLLAALLLWPVASVVHAGFHDTRGYTTDYVVGIFTDEYARNGLIKSLGVAAASTALVVVIGVGLAWLANRFRFRGQGLLGALILVPLILPPFVGAIGVRRILAPGGSVHVLMDAMGLPFVDVLIAAPYTLVVVLITLHLYPIMFLNVQAALANIDPALEEAARNLGADGWQVFRRVTLPLMRPGLFAGSAIVFIFSFTELGTPLVVGDRVRDLAAVQVFDGLSELSTRPTPFAMVTVLLVISAAVYLIGKVMLGRSPQATTLKATVAANPIALRGWRAVLVALPFLGVTGLALVPHVGVVLLSLAERWQDTVLPSPMTTHRLVGTLTEDVTGSAILNSLKYSGLATGLDLVLGFAVAYVVVRTRVVGRSLLDALAMLPLAVPGLVMAFGYLAITRAGSPLAVLNPREDPTLLLVVAYAIRRLPFMVRAAAAGLEQTSVTLEEAARNLGAGPWRTLRRITLPLVSANLIAGALLTFSFAMLEVSDSLVLAFEPDHFPITKAIYQLGLRIDDGAEMACALGVWAMALLAATLLLATWLLGRRLGTLFRI